MLHIGRKTGSTCLRASSLTHTHTGGKRVEIKTNVHKLLREQWQCSVCHFCSAMSSNSILSPLVQRVVIERQLCANECAAFLHNRRQHTHTHTQWQWRWDGKKIYYKIRIKWDEIDKKKCNEIISEEIRRRGWYSKHRHRHLITATTVYT